MKSVTAIAPIATRVWAAFLPCGGRKALTPFEIASTPVRAAAPEANARSTTKSPTAPTPVASGSGTKACGQVPSVHFADPVATSASIGDNERVGRKREENSGLADPAEVHHG